MRRINLVLLIAIVCMANVYAQQGKETFVTKAQLAGTWQRDYPEHLNGTNESFRFFADGRFEMFIGRTDANLVSTTELKGRYRLDQDRLYFTITSKTVVDGEIVVADPPVIFGFKNRGKTREVKISNPKEIARYCSIFYIKQGEIKLNAEVYYKVNGELSYQ